MPKASKPVSMMNKHLSKDEVEALKDAEAKVKTASDKVYEIPTDISKVNKKFISL